jgi:penicillin-binding protein 1A
VWVGFDNARTLGAQETGGKAAAPIWTMFMSSALRGEPEGFIQPEGIVSLYVDPKTGLLSKDDSGIKEYFREGTQPRLYSPTKSMWEITDPTQFNLD